MQAPFLFACHLNSLSTKIVLDKGAFLNGKTSERKE